MNAARALATMVLAAAAYGFAIGASKNATYAWRSMVKLPLLLCGTAAICSLAWFVTAAFVGAPLRFVAVQRVAWSLYRDVALLLGSLSPVAWFLGRTMTPPDVQGVGGYPAFVGTNMLFLAAAGAIAMRHRGRTLGSAHDLPPGRARALLAVWLALSLFVGGQLAFWLRPFFGIASLTGDPPFALGAEPTVTGARSFYEVVWQFVTAADPGDYTRSRGR